MESLADQVNRINKKIKQEEKRMSDLFIKKLDAVPENAEIKVLSTKPNCFVMKFSNLKDNWNPEFHNFDCQKTILVKMLKEKGMIDFLETLKTIVSKGTVKYKSQRHYFHPAMRAAIKKMVFEL